MARRKKGLPVHGWLVLDKPYDMGSTEAVSKAKWLLNAQKAGHAGTLDPLATGLLPIAFGEATKTVPFVQDGYKTYQFTARWGVQTTTDDLEGEVMATSDHRPSHSDIEAILPTFTGEIEQVPPAFSAIKIDGNRAYDLAREGEAVAPPPRTVTIEDLRLVDVPNSEEAVFEAVTSKGTYIRALVRDIAVALGTVGHVQALRRTHVGPFGPDDLMTFEDLTDLDEVAHLKPEEREPGRWAERLLPVDRGMGEYPSVPIDGQEAARLRSGGETVLPIAKVTPLRAGQAGDLEPILAVEGDEAVALCRLEGMKLRPTKVFVYG